MACSCECGNETSSSIKCGEFLEDFLASQDGLCYMELIRYVVIKQGK